MMHELMDLGHTYAFLYFFTYLILAQFIMLNLVVAVLLINYGACCARVTFQLPTWHLLRACQPCALEMRLHMHCCSCCWIDLL